MLCARRACARRAATSAAAVAIAQFDNCNHFTPEIAVSVDTESVRRGEVDISHS
jgi:hypothetical protein